MLDMGEAVRHYMLDVYKQREAALQELIGSNEVDLSKYHIWECITSVEDREVWLRKCFEQSPGYAFVGWLPSVYAWQPMVLVKEHAE